jgi:membrane-bound serine protease (ClpP class)
VALLGAILLAVLVVPAPWGLPVVAAGAAIEVAEAWVMLRWSRRRHARVGPEAMVGARAVVLEPGWARVAGERWRIRGAEAVEAGTAVEVEAVDGLTLVVRELP